MVLTWGGSGIEKVVFDYILSVIPVGSVVIELGSGHVSTQALSEHYKLTSIEHNEDYINHYKGVNYIHAPLLNDWYDINNIKLPKKKDQRLIFIDGVNRKGILKNLNLFNPKALYLIHDTYRDDEIELANELGKKLKRKPTFHTNGDYFATI